MKRLLISSLILLFSICLKAQYPGAGDPTFGNNGITTFAVSDYFDQAREVLVQPDGKIISAGYARMNGSDYQIYVSRQNIDGTMDITFGDNGIVVIDGNPGGGSYARAAALLPDGKILLGCYTFYYQGYTYYNDALVVKLNADGSLDTSFGNNGMGVFDGYNSSVVEDIRVQEDGKICLIGYCDDVSSVIRFNENGVLDTTYGNNGVALFSWNDCPTSYVFNGAFQDDGKLLLCGMYINDDNLDKCMIVRVNEDGTKDTSFGEDGIVKFSLGPGHDFIKAIKILDDGKILCAGHTYIKQVPVLNYKFAVTRLNPDGTFDTTFGQNGIATAEYYVEYENYLEDMVIAENGNIYCVGYCYNGVTADENLVVMSLLPDGSMNEVFGDNLGLTMIGNDGYQKEAYCIALTGNGHIVIGGYKGFKDYSGSDVFIARITSDLYDDVNEITDNAQNFVLYPNPTDEKLTVNIEDKDEYNASIYDLNGRIVMTAILKSNATIDVSSLPSGNYLIKMKSDNKTLVNHFVKK